MAEHVLCRRADLVPGRLTPARAGRMPVLVTLIGDRPAAIAARCPHQGADLSSGCIVDHVDADSEGHLVTEPGRPIVRCPWHGFEYDLATGEPCVPSPGHQRLRLRTLDVSERDGDIVIEI